MYLPDLPGKSAQLKMAPEHRIPTFMAEKEIPPIDAVESAVLVLLFPGKRDRSIFEDHILLDWQLLLIERSQYDGIHSGEISFPGGKCEPEDENYIATACREAQEEIALKTDHITIFGQMTPLYVPPSNHIIYPVLACACIEPELIPRNREVQSYKKIPLRYFDPACSVQSSIETKNGMLVKAPAYIYENYTIWGATAMIIAELYQLVLDARLITSFIRP
jgi:8-oxo-dGTP pyrophosphatase MutT (NUDIX family)